MHQRTKTILLNIIMIMVLFAITISAVPPYMSYQGRLTDDLGNPIDTVSAITFNLYPEHYPDSLLWTETHASVTVTDGLFSVFLGQWSALSPDIFDGKIVYLEIKLGDGPGSDPRIPILSSAYAIKAGHAGYADTADFAHASPNNAVGGGWVDDGSVIHLENNSDNVGIGTDTPTEKLDVDGNLRVDGTLNIADKLFYDPSTNKLTTTNNYINFDSTNLRTDGFVSFGGSAYANKRLTVYAAGVVDTIAILALNPTGTAGSFVSGTTSSGIATVPSAVYGLADGASIAGNFLSVGSGHALRARSNGAGNAVHGYAYGTGFSGFFEGGQGVKIDGDFEVTGSFTLPTGAVEGRILTSDASGVASWQAFSGGSSLWTLGGGNVYLADTVIQVAVGLTTPYPRRKLNVQTSGVGDTMALWVNNTTGIAASFYSNVGALSVTGTPAAIYARSGGSSAAAIFSSTGTGLGFSVSAAANDAIRASTSGSYYSARFSGGLGVLITGDLYVSGALSLPNGATDGHVLTSNASGVASWQEPSGGSSPWTFDVNETELYLSDITDRVAIGMTDPNNWNKLSVQAEGDELTAGLNVSNTLGTAARFYSSGELNIWSSIPSAVFGSAVDGGIGGYFYTADSGYAAVYGINTGTGYSAVFSGGQGVSISGDLDVYGNIDFIDNAITADEILNEPGLASEGSNLGPVLTSTMQDIETVSINIPSDGYILVQGQYNLRMHGSTGIGYVYSQIDETSGGGYMSPYYTTSGQTTFSNTNYHYYQISVHRVYYKTAGSYTFRLEAFKSASSTHTCNAYRTTVTALFIPTSYGTVSSFVSNPGDFENAKAEVMAIADENPNITKTMYKVDLRELELKAAKARAEAEQAERELMEAKLQEIEASLVDESRF